MDYSEEQIEKACEMAGAVPKTASHEEHPELREAVWHLVKGGLSMAELLGETRRVALEAAIDELGSHKAARKHLKISHTTTYRIKRRGNKF